MIIELIITALKDLPTRIPILAGKTIIVETNNAPAAGIIKAIATPVMILNTNDINLTGKPSTKAVSSSKVNIYMGRIKKADKKAKKRTKKEEPGEK